MNGEFNTDYYITIATVVPLLYITLLLQGQAVQDFSKKMSAVSVKQWFILSRSTDDLLHGRLRRPEQILKLLKSFLFTAYGVVPALYLALAAVLAGPVAAGYAIWALFFRSDVFAMRLFTMLATTGLFLLTILNPAAIVARNLFAPDMKYEMSVLRAMREDRRAVKEATKRHVEPNETENEGPKA